MAFAPRRPPPQDALSLLTAEHEDVRRLVRAFEAARRDDAQAAKRQAALDLCDAFERLAAVQREVFHPAAAAVLGAGEQALLDRVSLVRQGLHDLVSRIRVTPPGDPSFDALVLVLAEHARRALRSEEETLFVRLREAGLDLQATGARIAARLAELRRASGRQPRSPGSVESR